MKLSRYKQSSPVSYAFGATIVFELLKTHPELITRVFLRQNTVPGEDLARLLADLHKQQIEIIESIKAFNVLGAKDNCLLIAEFKKADTQLINSITAPHLILVNPSDAGNLGSIMRSAVAFNFSDLVIIKPAADPYDPKVIRASMGAIYHLNIQIFDSFAEYCAVFGSRDGQTRQFYAFMLNPEAQQLPTLPMPHNRHYGLIFGNEAAGLPKDFCSTQKYPITPVYIPQSPNVDSLNLSSSASIALYVFNQVN